MHVIPLEGDESFDDGSEIRVESVGTIPGTEYDIYDIVGTIPSEELGADPWDLVDLRTVSSTESLQSRASSESSTITENLISPLSFDSPPAFGLGGRGRNQLQWS